MVSIREGKRRMFLKMHNSLEKKMIGENLIWWKSLGTKARYSLLFKWIYYKKTNKKVKLKHFLSENKRRYNPSKVDIRNSIITILTNE